MFFWNRNRKSETQAEFADRQAAEEATKRKAYEETCELKRKEEVRQRAEYLQNLRQQLDAALGKRMLCRIDGLPSEREFRLLEIAGEGRYFKFQGLSANNPRFWASLGEIRLLCVLPEELEGEGR